MILNNFVLHSGGAVGADTEWDVQGQPHGVTARHYYAEGQRTPRGNVALTPAELQQADLRLERVNRLFLHRTWPTKSEFTNNLLRRNYYQVLNAEAVFAISTFVDDLVAGGTAWAVYMGILMLRPVYVFDQEEQQWFKWSGGGGVFHAWQHVDTPILTSHFAGVGTRELNDAGRQAIADVYRQTTEFYL